MQVLGDLKKNESSILERFFAAPAVTARGNPWTPWGQLHCPQTPFAFPLRLAFRCASLFAALAISLR